DAGGHGDADHTGLPRRYRGGGAGIGLGEVADRFHRVDGQIGGTSIGHGDGLRRTGSGNGDAPEEEGGGGGGHPRQGAGALKHGGGGGQAGGIADRERAAAGAGRGRSKAHAHQTGRTRSQGGGADRAEIDLLKVARDRNRIQRQCSAPGVGDGQSLTGT